MELYLRWLDKYERELGQGQALGLILCSDKNEKQIELLELDQGSLRVASYLTAARRDPREEARPEHRTGAREPSCC